MKQEIGTFVNRTRSGYGLKLVAIAVMLAGFIAPLAMVGQIINDRSFRSEAARNEIIESWGGRIGVSGPYLLVPLSRNETHRDGNGNPTQRRVTETVILFPETLSVDIDAATETRSRGIYSVPVAAADVEIQGNFDPARVAAEAPGWTVHWEETRIGLNVQQLKGLQGIDDVAVDGRRVAFEPAADRGVQWGEAIVAALPMAAPATATAPESEAVPFRIVLRINGGGTIAVMPVGRRTDVSIRSDWPSPSFFGSSLPATREYSEDGFSASWSVSYLSRSLPAAVKVREAEPGQAYHAYTDPFGVAFFQPDDPYARNERSFKYAWLFLIVPFLTFFLFEVIRKRRIHVVQYLLAGSADVVFYLLLLSISEQMTFMTAYLLAAAAITLLLAAYGTTVLRGVREGMLLGSMIGLGYGYLAIVLQSEDYALLLGSGGLFVVLAAVMYLTRNITWYGAEEGRDG
jgi:inner membrane protein